MSLSSHFKFESLDSTEFLNRRLQSLISRGIYSGGLLSPQSGTLNAVRSPFLAVGYDGMTVFDLDQQVVTFAAGQTSYHVVLAKYNPLGTPATPTLVEKVVTQAQYLADPDINYLIVIAKVVVPGGATELLASHIDYSVRDTIDPVSRAAVRGTVANVAALPTQVSGTNRTNDVYVVQSENSLYRWDGSAWQQIVAAGSTTLDGAYDNAGGSPGSGRQITADAGAVEISQASASPRGSDIGNSPLRVRTENSTIAGEVGVDITLPRALRDSVGVLVREALNDTINVTQNEAINISAGVGGPITFTRVGFDLSAGQFAYGGTGFTAFLIEVSGSGLGQDGLYIFSPTGINTGTVVELNGSTIVLAGESGLTATLYSVRSLSGGSASELFLSRFSKSIGSFELLGNFYTGTVIGKSWLYFDNMSSVWDVWRLSSGSKTRVLYLDDSGSNALLWAESLSAENNGSGNVITGSNTGTGNAGSFTADDGSSLNITSTGTNDANPTVKVTHASANQNKPGIKVSANHASGGYGIHSELTGAGPLTGRAVFGNSSSAAADDSSAQGIYGQTRDGVAVKANATGTGVAFEGNSYQFEANRTVVFPLIQFARSNEDVAGAPDWRFIQDALFTFGTNWVCTSSSGVLSIRWSPPAGFVLSALSAIWDPAGASTMTMRAYYASQTMENATLGGTEYIPAATTDPGLVLIGSVNSSGAAKQISYLDPEPDQAFVSPYDPSVAAGLLNWLEILIVGNATDELFSVWASGTIIKVNSYV